MVGPSADGHHVSHIGTVGVLGEIGGNLDLVLGLAQQPRGVLPAYD